MHSEIACRSLFLYENLTSKSDQDLNASHTSWSKSLDYSHEEQLQGVLLHFADLSEKLDVFNSSQYIRKSFLFYRFSLHSIVAIVSAFIHR